MCPDPHPHGDMGRGMCPDPHTHGGRGSGMCPDPHPHVSQHQLTSLYLVMRRNATMFVAMGTEHCVNSIIENTIGLNILLFDPH